MKLTLAEAIAQYNRSMSGNISPSSLTSYNAGLATLTRYLSEQVAVERITIEELEAWRYWLAFEYKTRGKSPLQPASQRIYLAGAISFFAWLHQRQKIPLDLAKMLSGKPANPIHWQDDENDPDNIDAKAIKKEHLMRLLQASQQAQDYRAYAIMMFMANTGARVSSLCALRVGEVTQTWERLTGQFDFTGGDLSLSKMQARIKAKGNKRLWVYFNERTGRAIRDYLFWERGFGEGHLFNCRREEVWRICNKYAQACGLGNATHNPHSFRHYFAIQSLKAGMPLTALSQLMGHSDISITINYYGKHIKSGLEDIARKYDTMSDF